MTGQRELLALASAIAREAGDGLLDVFSQLNYAELGVFAKSAPTDLVSRADVDTEEHIRARLRSARPRDAIVGEEGEDEPGSTGLRWVVDPLDGTVNFLSGIPQWCVSIACEDEDGALAGVVYDAARRELWAATRDGDATLDGEAIRFKERRELAMALVATGFAYDPDVRGIQADTAARLSARVGDFRQLGSAALDLVWTAAGRYDVYYEREVNSWDIAAGALICLRAGLEVLELPPAPPLGGGILVAPATLSADLYEFLTS